jgi:hypothetical protein
MSTCFRGYLFILHYFREQTAKRKGQREVRDLEAREGSQGRCGGHSYTDASVELACAVQLSANGSQKPGQPYASS